MYVSFYLKFSKNDTNLNYDEVFLLPAAAVQLATSDKQTKTNCKWLQNCNHELSMDGHNFGDATIIVHIIITFDNSSQDGAVR